MTDSSGQPAKGWVLYDGACGICSRWVQIWRATLSRRGLKTAPLQSTWVPEQTGLAPDTLLSDLRLLHTDGRLTSGAEAYRYIMRMIWWLFPLYLLSLVPGLRSIFDRSYRSFARHRRRISASCDLG